MFKNIQTKQSGYFAKCWVLGLSLFSLACTAESEKVEKVYQNYCASCHGDKMQGGQAPSLIDDNWKYGSSNTEIANVIKNGAGNGGMPAFGKSFSEQQIGALVIYMREVAAEPREETPSLSVDTILSAGGAQFKLEKVSNIPGKIWSMAFAPNGQIIATVQEGKLYVLENGQLSQPVVGLPEVFYKEQGGLLEVVLHPDYANNAWVYLSYSDPADGVAMTRVVRGKIKNGLWLEQQDVFVAPKRFYTDRPWHFGSRMAFLGDKLYLTVGERTESKLAQDLNYPNGKIFRLNDDGAIPSDNPFVDKKDSFLGIWSYGHRNQQGLAVDPRNGDLWSSEHGPRGGDELNLVEKGKNYGWPVITYGMNYDGTPWTDSAKTHQAGMEQPKLYWVPSIAVSDIDFYTGDVFPTWKNKLLVSSLAKQELHLVTIEDQQVISDEILFKNYGRIRDVDDGLDGYPYVVINEKSTGTIYRLVPVK